MEAYDTASLEGKFPQNTFNIFIGRRSPLERVLTYLYTQRLILMKSCRQNIFGKIFERKMLMKTRATTLLKIFRISFLFSKFLISYIILIFQVIVIVIVKCMTVSRQTTCIKWVRDAHLRNSIFFAKKIWSILFTWTS